MRKLTLERRVREILRGASDDLTAWKLPTDLRLTGNGVVHGEPMPADFMGYRHNDGKVFFVECKEVERNTLPLGKKPGLSPFQMQAMVEAKRHGVRYVLVWGRPSLERFAVRVDGEDEGFSLAWPSGEFLLAERQLPRALLGAIMGG